jgi:hypothetical protein
MLGQSADRVLHGALPHVDYEESYTGALTWLYAAAFKVRGVDLLNVRWLLLGAACVALILTYAIARRFVPPAGAAVATWVALVWSFPNYFAGLPSWWLLVCALWCAFAFMRYGETAQIGYLAVAGLAAGLAVTIKQTGLYVAVALFTSIVYAVGPPFLGKVIAPLTAALPAVALGPRIAQAEGVYLFLPVLACSAALFMSPASSRPAGTTRGWLAPMAVAGLAAAAPVVVLLAPYLMRHRLWDFVNGAILAPQKRLAFASMSMPPAWLIVTAAPLVAIAFFEPVRRMVARSKAASIAVWIAAIGLPAAALWNTTAYQAIWQSTRAFAALLPIGICWRITSERQQAEAGHAVLFMSASLLSWLSLNQFPFAAPIYFMYAAPVAVLAALAIARDVGTLGRKTMLPWAAMLVLFGVLSANRGYIQNLGVEHQRSAFDTPLDLPRAHLQVGDGDAHVYRTLVSLVGSHFHGGQLVAGPDCPEVYFLTGLVSPSGALFEFFSGAGEEDASRWLRADVIVVNHEPWFSPKVSDGLMADLRREFPMGERTGRFEIRWR